MCSGSLAIGVAFDGLDDGSVLGHRHHLAVLDDQELAGAVQHRRDVGGEEHLAVTDAHDEWADPPHCNDLARFQPGHHHQGVRTLGFGNGPPHRGFEVTVVLVGDEMGEYLGIRIGGERVPEILQLLLERQEVLDDAVVDDNELARWVGMGVSIEIAWLAVSGPPGVADADRSLNGSVGK